MCSVKLPKVLEKSTPKPSKSIPKTFENPPQNGRKSIPKRSKIEIWKELRFGSLWTPFFSRILGCLGPSGVPLGAVLERSWGVWGRLWGALPCLRGGLEAYVARVGSLLARPWDVLGRLGAS